MSDVEKLNTFNLYIFGGTGDLANRKLLPALYRQHILGSYTDQSNITGIGTKDLSQDDYLSIVQKSLQKHSDLYSDESWKKFSNILTYKKIDINDDEDWNTFKPQQIDAVKIFYLAIPPSLYETISTKLHSYQCIDQNSRIVVEKPIGSDLETAKKINKSLSIGFSENQIYRIDHYLGKEAVQNLLALRFGNIIFEQSWSNRAIDHIQITVAEDLGVEDRGNYYDKTGALKDMVQNHLIQILCLIAMEPPVSINSESVRDEKLKVLKSLAPFDINTIKTDSVRGRYSDGVYNKEAVKAYVDEDGVDEDNNTETFVALKLFINNWRWSGVPFFLRTGKRMKKKVSEIVVRYKNIPHNIFSSDTKVHSNQLVLRIHPDEGVDLKLNTKEPSVTGFHLEELPLDLNLQDYYEMGHQDCYERLLLDVIKGNQALFVRKDEIEASWEWIDSITKLWSSEAIPMDEYSAGSWGPSSSELMLSKENKKWIDKN
tara:strand:+ start:431 stop:1888 length:1458 start_codon:yes stop_codon:yes gene_type:complete